MGILLAVHFVPQTRYARTRDGIDIAYQCHGEGDANLVGVPGIVSNIEVIWEHPEGRAFLEGLGSFSRFVHFDKRGQGLSERVPGVPTLEQRADDLEAVMDAAGVERAVICGVSEGGTTAAFFAATRPQRAVGLCVFGGFARVLADVDYDGATPAVLDKLSEFWPARWGQPETMSVALIAPDRQGDTEFLQWVNRFERASSTPSGLSAQLDWVRDLDIRSVLPSIAVPTLVVHRAGDALVPAERGRWLASHISGARYVELPGTAHVPYLDIDQPLAVIEEFVTGRRRTPVAERVLATVLFTDIVGSTELAAKLGDRRWCQLLDRHDALARAAITDAGGRVVKSTGDGLVATFSGPASGVRSAMTVMQKASQAGLTLRAGLHTGEVELRDGDIAGIGVHIAARVSAEARGGEILVSRTVKDLVTGSGICFSDRGEHELKGVPDRWQLLSVTAV